jgi:hypothetical protein
MTEGFYKTDTFKTSTADRRCQSSLRKLQNNLGGDSPYQ